MNIEINERISEYYVVTVEREEYNWTFRMNDGAIGREPWKTIDAWCEQTFGEQGVWGSSPSPWKRMGPSYFFQHEKDCLWFTLRWS